METTRHLMKYNVSCDVNNGHSQVNIEKSFIFMDHFFKRGGKKGRSFLAKADNTYILCCSSCGFLWMQHKILFH